VEHYEIVPVEVEEIDFDETPAYEEPEEGIEENPYIIFGAGALLAYLWLTRRRRTPAQLRAEAIRDGLE
jgi:hypothetical protein